MDNLLLSGVVGELSPAVLGQSLSGVAQTLEGDLVLQLVPGGRRLRLGAGAGRSCLYTLRGHPPLAGGLSPFASRLLAEAGGASLEGLHKEADERVVRFRFAGRAGGRTLVAELLGRSANMVCLDAEGRVLAAARALNSAFRSPVEGEKYLPPPADPRAGVLEAPPARVEELMRAAGSEPLEMEHALARGVRGLGALMAREVVWLAAGEGRPLAEVWTALQARLRDGCWQPCLYTPVPLEEVQESTPLEARNCFAAPWPLACASALCSSSYSSVSEALEAHDRLWERWRRLQRACAALAGAFEEESRRLDRLIEALRADQERGAQAGQFRQWGERLLRAQDFVRLEGRTAIVVDRLGGGAQVQIPFNPALDRRQNAEAMFRQYKRLKGAAPGIERRLLEAQGRLQRLRPLAAQARAARTLSEVEALAERWRVVPRGGAQSRTLRSPVGARGQRPQAREFRTSDGWTVLVGRGARANERLTFEVAAPHDFWMHAADYPGAHVVVRNPKRLPGLPARALEEAAALAAWYSKARASGRVEVHYTQRRHVRRAHGATPGQVLVKRFRSIAVRPRDPQPGA